MKLMGLVYRVYSEQIWKRGNEYVGKKSAAAARGTRLPSGHPEAFLEAFANNYCNFADTIRKVNAQKKASKLMLDFPGVQEGLSGMLFIESVLASAKSKTKWTKMKK